MRENTLKKLWAGGGVAVVGWLSIPSAFSAEEVSAVRKSAIGGRLPAY